MRRVLIVVLILAGCSGAHPTSRPTKVLEVGDSITLRIAGPTEIALGPSYHVYVFARVARVVADLPKIRALIAAQKPDVTFVELGADDAGYADSSWRQPFARLVDISSTARCVVFVTVSPIVDYFARRNKGAHPTVGADWNRALRAAVASHRNFRLIDWAAVALTKGFTYDGFHPSPAGNAWFAANYKAAAATC